MESVERAVTTGQRCDQPITHQISQNTLQAVGKMAMANRLSAGISGKLYTERVWAWRMPTHKLETRKI